MNVAEPTTVELLSIIRDLKDEISALRAEIDELKQHNGKEHADMNRRMSDIEEDVHEDVDDAPCGREEPSTWTPLDRVISLSEEIAARELTSNQQRARFVAKDCIEYAAKAPAGYILDSSTIRTVLSARNGSKCHTETVSRVMNFLSDLGGEDVKQLKRHGKKIIAIGEEAAKRYTNHEGCDGGGRMAVI